MTFENLFCSNYFLLYHCIGTNCVSKQALWFCQLNTSLGYLLDLLGIKRSWTEFVILPPTSLWQQSQPIWWHCHAERPLASHGSERLSNSTGEADHSPTCAWSGSCWDSQPMRDTQCCVSHVEWIKEPSNPGWHLHHGMPNPCPGLRVKTQSSGWGRGPLVQLFPKGSFNGKSNHILKDILSYS